MRALIIEDDVDVARSVGLILQNAGTTADVAAEGEEGIDLARRYDYDVILLDLGLPDMTGYEVLSTLRRARVGTPVIVLSGDANVESRVRSLGLGADDYLTKPFARDELAARMAAVVRRSRGHAASTIEIGPLSLDLDAKQASVDGAPVALTGKEYALLELLALRRGTTLTKDMILNNLYGGLDEPEAKIIDVFVCKLRKKLAKAGGKGLIETVWGRGYLLRTAA